MASAEVKYVSGPHRQNNGGAQFWVKVGKSETLRPVDMTRAQLIRFCKQALSIMEGDARE
jgi:hypothetical protein